MKRYIPLIVLMATALLLGMDLKSEGVIQYPWNCRLVVGTDYFNGYAASSDYPVYAKVYGTVYFHAELQNEAIVTLTHDSTGSVWQDTTAGGGDYELRCPLSGWYHIQACYLGDCSRSRNFYIRPHSFDQVRVRLCIGIDPQSPCLLDPLPVDR